MEPEKIAVMVPLTKGYITLIDAEDVPLVTASKWCAIVTKAGRVYAYGHVPGSGTPGRKTYLHRYLTGAGCRVLVDHENGNTLDNRRKNLRKCSTAQNTRNSKGHRDRLSSRYKGVYLNRKAWVAQITVDGRNHYLGSFQNEEDAARAYNAAAEALHGDFARPNVLPKAA